MFLSCQLRISFFCETAGKGLALWPLPRGFRFSDGDGSSRPGGGTVLHAKGTGAARAEKFFGVSLADEKDMVYIIAYADEKAAILKSINEKAGPGTKAGAICFSLPISSVAGLRSREED